MLTRTETIHSIRLILNRPMDRDNRDGISFTRIFLAHDPEILAAVIPLASYATTIPFIEDRSKGDSHENKQH